MESIMSSSRSILIRIRRLGLVFGCIFLVLMLVRFGVLDYFRSKPKRIDTTALANVSVKESWLNIYQNQRKIGFSYSRLTPMVAGYQLNEDVVMRINTMGMIQDIRLKTDSLLNTDMSLAEFDVSIASGRFEFTAKGKVDGKKLTLRTTGAGESERRAEIDIQEKPYLTAGVIGAISAVETAPGEAYAFDVFDPTTMGQQTVRVDIVGPEQISLSGKNYDATKISLSFKGASQYAWIDQNGDLLKQSGLLGIRMEKTSREEALNQAAIESSDDLTLQASVPIKNPIPEPNRLKQLTLSISGVSTDRLQLSGGRQKYAGNRLHIEKESLEGLPSQLEFAALDQLGKIFLDPEPLIQADHPKIKDLVQTIIGPDERLTPLEKIRLLTDWVHQNIAKRPVVAVPDALSTLENRMGDCNEHAMLLAAMARAAQIPTRVEAGLVYLKGRFYYHAWNLVYLGRWVTVDALFGQLPADVTHIRLVTGSQQQQLDLIGLIGNIAIDVIDYD